MLTRYLCTSEDRGHPCGTTSCSGGPSDGTSACAQVQLQIVNAAEQVASYAGGGDARQRRAAANAYLVAIGSSATAAASLTDAALQLPFIAAAVNATQAASPPAEGTAAELAATVVLVNGRLKASAAPTGPDVVLDWAKVSIVAQGTFKQAAADLGSGKTTPAAYRCAPCNAHVHAGHTPWRCP